MPNSVVKSFADKTGKSVEDIEKIWKETEEQVKAEYKGKEVNYAIVTSIVKKKIGLKENFIKEIIKQKLNEQK